MASTSILDTWMSSSDGGKPSRADPRFLMATAAPSTKSAWNAARSSRRYSDAKAETETYRRTTSAREIYGCILYQARGHCKISSLPRLYGNIFVRHWI